MSQSAQDQAEALVSRFEAQGATVDVATAEVTMTVPTPALIEVATALRDDEAFAYHQLTDLCAVDYLGYGKADWETSETTSSTGFSRAVETSVYHDEEPALAGRFAVVYHLLSHGHNRRLRLKTLLEEDPPRVDSVCEVWPGANWFEREAFDLFGILFPGHPDLRRILTDYGFIGHPFRKDFPLIGEVEMRYDPAEGRVVYEPVSIEPRTLVPKVIRHDQRYDDSDEAA